MVFSEVAYVINVCNMERLACTCCIVSQQQHDFLFLFHKNSVFHAQGGVLLFFYRLEVAI